MMTRVFKMSCCVDLGGLHAMFKILFCSGVYSGAFTHVLCFSLNSGLFRMNSGYFSL